MTRTQQQISKARYDPDILVGSFSCTIYFSTRRIFEHRRPDGHRAIIGDMFLDEGPRARFIGPVPCTTPRSLLEKAHGSSVHLPCRSIMLYVSAETMCKVNCCGGGNASTSECDSPPRATALPPIRPSNPLPSRTRSPLFCPRELDLIHHACNSPTRPPRLNSRGYCATSANSLSIAETGRPGGVIPCFRRRKRPPGIVIIPTMDPSCWDRQRQGSRCPGPTLQGSV